MSEIGYLALGYAVVWVVLGAYLFTLGRRHVSLRREVERLERELPGEDGTR